MNKHLMKIAAYGALSSVLLSTASMNVKAETVSKVLPSAGIIYTLGADATSLSDILEASTQTIDYTKKEAKSEAKSDATSVLDEKSVKNETEVEKALLSAEYSVMKGLVNIQDEAVAKKDTAKIIEDTVIVSRGYTEDLAVASGATSEEEGFKNLVIAQVNNYVNVRSIPSEEGEIVGKLYNDSVGNFIEEQDGWYKISSGSVEGYVKGEFCVTGEAAVELAKQVGTRIATVNTTTLYVRSEPTTDSPVIGMVPIEDDLLVTEEVEGWVKVNIEEGDGYVSTDYVVLSTEFVKAESKAEEEARLAKEAAEREAALAAAAARSGKMNKTSESTESSGYADTGVYAPAGSGTGSNVANFALQFVGNPYVYGGTSLTNGADCSGFVMSVYQNFGVSLPHSSSADRSVGATVSSLAEAQPGDIICYSGHVALYIGNGQIVHASTARTGIKVSDVGYRKILSIRRIF